MKLLKRQIINSQVADQRRQQIEEGLSLAKKVDALRNEMLNLQRQRNDFIEGSKSEMEKILKPLHEKKESLESEIKILQEIKEKLRIHGLPY